MAKLTTIKADPRKSKEPLPPKKAMGNAYGHGIKENILFTTDEMTLRRTFEKAGYNTVVVLDIEGQKEPIEAMFKDVYFGNMSDAIHHADFYAIKRGEKIQVEVPVVIVGEAPGTLSGNVLVQAAHEVVVKAAPANLPSEYEIDVSSLKEPGDNILVGDLKVEDGVEIEDPEDKVLAKLDMQRSAEADPATDEDEAADDAGGAAEVPSDHGGDGDEGDSK